MEFLPRSVLSPLSPFTKVDPLVIYNLFPSEINSNDQNLRVVPLSSRVPSSIIDSFPIMPIPVSEVHTCLILCLFIIIIISSSIPTSICHNSLNNLLSGLWKISWMHENILCIIYREFICKHDLWCRCSFQIGGVPNANPVFNISANCNNRPILEFLI